MDYLNVSELAGDPVEQFERWFAAAAAAGETEPEAMALATADAAGHPSVRYVLMRRVDDRGWAFYTNTRSRKGSELGTNPWAALAFRWAKVGRQVRVTGPVIRLPDEDADAYFATRARESQIGAWVSDQSEVLVDRATLRARYYEAEGRFEEGAVPRPDWWGGYLVQPEEVEFWQQGEFRLHDRFRYLRDGAGWRLERLYP